MKSRPPSKLVVAVLSLSNFLEIEKKDESHYKISGGIEGRFLKSILTALGIEYELVFPADGEYGREESNGSWTGLIGMVQRGEADLACGGLIFTERRKEIVDFSSVYAITPLTFVIGKAKWGLLKHAYLYPFEADVWKCLFGLFIVFSAVMWLVYRGKYSIERIVFELCGNALRQPFMLVGYTWNSKFVQALCCVYALVITTGYSGVLYSFLTLPVEGKSIENFGQLAEGVMRGTHRCYVLRGTLYVSYLLSSNEKHLQLLGRAISRNSWYVRAEDMDNHTIINQHVAFLSTRLVLQLKFPSSFEQKSDFFISKDVFAESLIGIIANRKFCCIAKLNKIISRAHNAGLLEKYFRDFSFRHWLSNRDRKAPTTYIHSVTVEEISGALLILCSGYVISFAFLLAEILFNKNVR